MESALVPPRWEITCTPQILEQSRRGAGEAPKAGAECGPRAEGGAPPGEVWVPPWSGRRALGTAPGASCAGGVGLRPPSRHVSACTRAPPLRHAPLGRPSELSAPGRSGRLVPIRAVPAPASRGAGRGDIPPSTRILQVLKATGFPEPCRALARS